MEVVDEMREEVVEIVFIYSGLELGNKDMECRSKA